MKNSEAKKKLQEIQNAQNVENLMSNINRARSITVGTAFGGTTELMMRSDGGRHIYCIMQPVEVIELLHQLSANVGCHLQLKPRDDFSSWREWRVSDAEKKHLQGHAPFVNDMAVFQQLGASHFDQDKAEAIVKDNLAQKEYGYINGAAIRKSSKKRISNEAVATKETINERTAKRATKTS